MATWLSRVLWWLPKAIVPAILVALAIYAGWVLYTPPDKESRWAELDDLNAWWIVDGGPKLGIAFKFTANEACDDYTVTKVAFPVRPDGSVDVTRGIVFNGDLRNKVAHAAVGPTVTLHDEANPLSQVEPGQYQLSLTVTCDDGGPALLETTPIKTLFEVPKPGEQAKQPRNESLDMATAYWRFS